MRQGGGAPAGLWVPRTGLLWHEPRLAPLGWEPSPSPRLSELTVRTEVANTLLLWILLLGLPGPLRGASCHSISGKKNKISFV